MTFSFSLVIFIPEAQPVSTEITHLQKGQCDAAGTTAANHGLLY